MSTIVEQVEIDFMLLADKAEIHAGKLYMMGGAWDRLHVKSLGAPVSLSLIIGVLVPWTLTNEPHQLRIRIEDEDGNPVPPSAEASINVGRPSESTKGQSFRAMAVINNHWTLPRLGAYSVIASVSGRHEKRVTFYAVG